MDDWDILQQFVLQGSNAALEELVRRYAPMVYAAALRQVGDASLAEDITQAVFLLLMRKAAGISRSVVLGGWLYNVTRFAAAKEKRSRYRRMEHERKAARMKPEAPELDAIPGTALLSPLLDDAIASLPRSDRDAVVMRYLEGRSCREVAGVQKISEEAARKRLSRAVSKLRVWFRRKEVVVTDESIGAALFVAGNHPGVPEVTARVIAGLHGSAAAAALTIAELTARIIVMTKLKLVAVTSLIAILLATTGGFIVYKSLSNRPHLINVVPPVASIPTPPPLDLTAIGPAETPTGTLVGAFNAAAAGDGDALIACFDHLTPQEQVTLRHAANVMAFGEKFRAAVAAHYGESAAQSLMQSVGFDFGATRQSFQNAVPVINGDVATMRVAPMGQTKMTRVGKLWKMSEGLVKGAPAAGIAMADAATPLFNQIIVAINSGKFQNIQDLRLALKPITANFNDRTPAEDPPDRPAVLGPGTTPKETIAALRWANVVGDQDAAVSCVNNPSPEVQTSIRTDTRILHAGEQVREAIKSQFTAGLAQRLMLNLGLASPVTKTALAAAPETDTADTARVDKLGIGPVDLIKTGDVWKIEPSLYGTPNPLWEQRLLDYYVPKLDQLAADIRAGRYAAPNDLQDAVSQLSREIGADYKRLAPPKAGTTRQ